MSLLAGDVGGTKTALAVYERGDNGTYRTIAEGKYASQEYKSFADVLAQFLPKTAGRIDAAAFGVAGPVVNGVCSTTNLPWTMSELELAQIVGAPVSLINDFHAVALGVGELQPDQLHVLQAGARNPKGTIAVIGAGTGLGEALCVHTSDGPHVIAGEGGHSTFAPHTELEVKLLQFLMTRYEHVSVERVVSGIALPELYEFVVDAGLAKANPETLRRSKTESVGAVLSELAPVDPAAEITLSLFVSAYGAEAGNLALKALPTGGLFVAGGIAPRILPRLTSGAFMASFLAKGRLSSVLTPIPVAVVLHPNVGLLGARAQAGLLSSRRPR
ncbi:MAG TPA: glucokinase [Polyangiales bacterium]|nr:glucokinase [Polyangiales bacterium]